MRRRAPILFVLVTSLAPQVWAETAETGFWEEMATPGITEYRVHIAAAQERIRAADHEGALVSLRRAVVMLPDQAEGHLWTAYCESMLERHEEALRSWERAVSIDRTVLDDETISFRFTITLARVGRYQQAARIYEQLLARGVSPALRPIVLLNMGDMLVAASCDGLDEAIDLYQECARDYPDMAGCHWGLAAALFRDGRRDEADQELSTAERLDSQWRSLNSEDVFFVPSYEVHLYRALGWHGRGNPGQARLELDEYLEGGGAQGCWSDLIRQTRDGLDRGGAGRR